MKVNELTISQYFAIENDALKQDILTYVSKQSTDWLPDNLYETEFEKIIELRSIEATDDLQLMKAQCKIWGINENFVKAYQLSLFLDKHLALINEEEKRKFDGNTLDADDINAGVNELSIFGFFNVLDAIGQRYGQFPEDSLKRKYIYVISTMHKIHIENKINKRIHENITNSTGK